MYRNIRGLVAKRDDEEFVVVKAAVPSSLKLQFKVLCTQKQLKMSEVLEEVIEKWIQADAPISESTADLSDEDYQAVKGYVPKSLKLQFKVLCTQKRVKMRFVVHNLIQEWVLSGGSANKE